MTIRRVSDMALKPSDPWYLEPSDPRYKRALALSEMRHFIEIYEKNPEAAKNRTAQITYRKNCLENWQQYLNGEIKPPTGRRPKAADEIFQKRTVTLPPRQIEAIERLQNNGEDFSSVLQRLIDVRLDPATEMIIPVDPETRALAQRLMLYSWPGVCRVEELFAYAVRRLSEVTDD